MSTATESKHSLAPWRIVRSGDELDIRSAKFAREPFPTSIHIATMSDCDERDANARLIAAAPAMLEALEAIVAEADQSNGGKGARLPITVFIRGIAEAAIKTVKGESQ